jgi:hypothetical protein
VREQLRLKLIVPLVVIALGGLAVAKFVLLKDDSSEAEAATPPAAIVDPAAEPGEPPAATTTEEEPAEAEQPPAKNVGLLKLEKALKKKKIVVVVVYSPKGAVDAKQVSEARTGAAEVKVGFLALNAAKEKEIGEFAQAYDVRETPLVLVFRRGPKLVARFETFADDVTVSQAAHDARHAR